MLQKTNILDRIISGANRFFKVNLFSRQVHNLAQFGSGGDDYSPPVGAAEGLAGTIGNNPANGVVFAWRDNILRKAQPGEKRIYAVNAEDGTVAGEVYLKNDGVIEINNAGDLKIVAYGNVSVITPGNVDVSAASVNVAASVVNLGEGGAGIARLGDEVTVEVTGGSSAGTYKGTITSAGVNTSI